MVHSKLISEGKVQPLTYSQLRRIEKIDAKKARDLALIDAGKEAIGAVGRIGEGVMSNQIAGTVLLALGLIAYAPEYVPILEHGAFYIANGLIALWKNGILPDVTSTVTSTLGVDTTNGLYGIEVVDLAGNVPDGSPMQWYNTTAARDAAFAFLATPGLAVAEGWFAHGGTGFKKISRRFTEGGGFVTYQSATPPATIMTISEIQAYVSSHWPKGTPVLVGEFNPSVVKDQGWTSITTYPDATTITTEQNNPTFISGSVQTIIA